MQRKYQFLWLALVPFGAAGALATGMVSLPWPLAPESQPNTRLESRDDAQPATKAVAKPPEVKSTPKAKSNASKLAALDKQAKPAKAPLTKAPESAGTPKLSTKKKGKFGIDIARISPDGSSVIAGYATPGKPFTVMADGKPVGVVTPDQSGDWVLITPHKFANMDPQITLQAGDLTAKTVAALTAKPATPANVSAAPATAKPTASQVTQQMLQRLRKLTRESEQEAKAQPAATKKPAAQTKPVAKEKVAAPKAATPKTQAAPKQRLALATTKSPSRLGGPASPASAGGKAKSSASPTAKSEPAKPSAEKSYQVAAAPKPLVPSTVEAEKAAPSTAAQPAAIKKVARTETLPVPVQFVYRRDVFTEQGREAAALLLKYFKVKKFSSVVLSGHADERGTPAANHKLSHQRLVRIREFLRDGGFDGRLKLVPKGETEKFTGVDRSKFSTEELYQLDRRVEVMSAE